ncbi:MAG: hypothetical protein Phyf2KO_06770 [Phycisphaerales bacterium]
MISPTEPVEIIATAAFGVEASVKWELSKLGYEAKVTSPGRLSFDADPTAIVRSNLHLRAADRVLVVAGRFRAKDFDDLFAGVAAIDWKRLIPEGARVTPRVGIVRSPLKSPRSAQSVTKRAIVESIAGKGNTLDESADEVVVDVSVLGEDVTVSLDSSGAGLHKRGYRQRAQAGQLKETLGAALVMICRWRRDQPLIDPFCGSGTIPIEAALLASNRAPGIGRSFAAEHWPWIGESVWELERSRASEQVDDSGIAPIIASDINPQSVGLARQCAENAGVAHLVRFDLGDYRELETDLSRGWVITNPPYGVRVGEEKEAKRIQKDLPAVLSRLPSFSHGLMLGGSDFEPIIGKSATRKRKLYNAKIQCTLYQFAPSSDDSPAFSACANGHAMDQFRAALSKRARHFRKWPSQHDIHAFRAFDGEVLGLRITVDRLGESVRVEDRGDPGKTYSADKLNILREISGIASEVMDIAPDSAHRVHRSASSQRASEPVEVVERGVKYELRPSEISGAGLDLSLRELRAWVTRRAKDSRVLDLCARPGQVAECAAAVASDMTAYCPDDLAQARLRRNLKLNGVDSLESSIGDPVDAIDQIESERFDLVVCVLGLDEASRIAPAFADLLQSCAEVLRPGGTALLAVPSGTKADEDSLGAIGFPVKELTKSLIPDDFVNAMPWRVWACRAPAD